MKSVIEKYTEFKFPLTDHLQYATLHHLKIGPSGFESKEAALAFMEDPTPDVSCNWVIDQMGVIYEYADENHWTL